MFIYYVKCRSLFIHTCVIGFLRDIRNGSSFFSEESVSFSLIIYRLVLHTWFTEVEHYLLPLSIKGTTVYTQFNLVSSIDTTDDTISHTRKGSRLWKINKFVTSSWKNFDLIPPKNQKTSRYKVIYYWTSLPWSKMYTQNFRPESTGPVTWVKEKNPLTSKRCSTVTYPSYLFVSPTESRSRQFSWNRVTHWTESVRWE